MKQLVRLNPLIPVKLTRNSWILSLLSVVVVGIFSLISLLQFTQLRSNYLSTLLFEQLQSGQIEVTGAILQSLERKPPLILGLLGSESILDDTKGYQVDILMKGLGQIHMRETTKAYRLVKDLLNTEQSSLFNSYLKEQKEIRELNTRIRAREKALKESMMEYSLLAADFGELIGSSPLESEDQMMESYTAGILKDLPILKGVPDNISELSDLAPYLLQMRGTLERDDALSFREDLQRMKTSSTVLRREYEVMKQDDTLDKDAMYKKLQESVKLLNTIKGLLIGLIEQRVGIHAA